MAIYTVYEPPLRRSETAPDPERFAFVRDGFSFWAFLLAPIWMLWHRLWLVFVGYVVVAVALELALRAVGASSTVTVAAGVLLALLVGFEAATLRRFTLSRRRWKNAGIVVGDDLEAAEHRFFDTWVRNGGAVAAPQAAPLPRRPAPASDVIGLFPQPGAPR